MLLRGASVIPAFGLPTRAVDFEPILEDWLRAQLQYRSENYKCILNS
jgi:hypothetical protein